ncbi:hypothetical protein LCGC14_0532170 [marine sediment metagenome]|uniref:Uncharacterized protein n=1 Tax=marine sediment metagenome TaxID=412755 RepID=A0A0F9V3D4_9ZZZZ
MGKIGKPLVVETAKPRIHPKTLPEPQPETVPKEQPEKEKVPVIKSRLKGSMASVSVMEQIYLSVEAGIPRVAKFFGVPEQQVIDGLVALVAHAHDVLRYLGAAKGSTVSRTV